MGLRFAANLSMLWTDRAPYERFDAAAAAGFTTVEMLFPQPLETDRVINRLEALGLTMALFDLNAGDFAAGERGIAALPDRVMEFRKKAVDDLDLAYSLGVRTLTVLAGRRPESLPAEEADATLVENLTALAPQARERDITLTLEAINQHDVPGYHVRTVGHAARVLESVDHPHVRMQFDQYHVSREGQDPLCAYEQHRPIVAHVQIADAPGRHEPGTGKAPIMELLRRLDRDGYSGVVGLEYQPSDGGDDASLEWLSREDRAHR
ncbi:MAG: TIM barrel protein [Dehalococcoidia bacterium]